MSRLLPLITAADRLALECLAEALQIHKLELLAELWHPGIDREVAEIDRHLAVVDARLNTERKAA